MPNPQNVTKNKIKKGEIRNPKGRPKKLQTQLKKEGLAASQITAIILEMLAMTREEIDAIVKNPKSKSFELLLAAAIKKGVSKGDLTQIFGQALQRALGAPKQEIETNVRQINISVRGVKIDERSSN